MNKKAVLSALFILFLVAGCAGPAAEPAESSSQDANLPSSSSSSEPTITNGKDSCIYSGPSELPVEFELTWNVEDSGGTEYMYFIATLDEGKTLDDLDSEVDLRPTQPWIHSIHYDTTLQPGTRSKMIDLNETARFTGGPIYFVCYNSMKEAHTGVAGPIDVVE